MKKELIRTLTATFEGHAQQTEAGIEYWLARDLQYLLGYSKWDNFMNVVSRASMACEISGHEIKGHFADVGKMVDSDATSSAQRRRYGRLARCAGLGNQSLADVIDGRSIYRYGIEHIRPMAVSPLDHPERWPTPWGFLFLNAKASVTGPLQWRSV